MSLITEETSRFRKDLRRIFKQGKNFFKLEKIIRLLLLQEPIPPHHRNHPLKGSYTGCMECHIEPDWLLIYKINYEKQLLILLRTGSHSDLFG